MAVVSQVKQGDVHNVHFVPSKKLPLLQDKHELRSLGLLQVLHVESQTGLHLKLGASKVKSAEIHPVHFVALS